MQHSCKLINMTACLYVKSRYPHSKINRRITPLLDVQHVILHPWRHTWPATRFTKLEISRLPEIQQKTKCSISSLGYRLDHHEKGHLWPEDRTEVPASKLTLGKYIRRILTYYEEPIWSNVNKPFTGYSCIKRPKISIISIPSSQQIKLSKKVR